MKFPPVSALIAAFALISCGNASHHAQYAGQQDRDIKSLSEDDVAAIERGAGWGLAKPAELNGYPGPLHVLELADELDLSSDQRNAVQSIYDRMNAEAKAYGAAFLQAERALDDAFEENRIDETSLTALLQEAGSARAALRDVHLRAHLETKRLLSDAQIETYIEKRGYGNGHAGHSGH